MTPTIRTAGHRPWRREQKGRLSLDFGHLDGVANRVAVGEVAPCEGLVDDDERGAAMVLRLVPDASLEQRDLADTGKYSGLTMLKRKRLILRGRVCP